MDIVLLSNLIYSEFTIFFSIMSLMAKENPGSQSPCYVHLLFFVFHDTAGFPGYRLGILKNGPHFEFV